jgi:hypothetical protein
MPFLKLRSSIDSSENLVKVPDGEYMVLTVLASLKQAHAPAIARASKGSISVAAIYKLLSRLESRGLVHKQEEYVQIGDITAKRMIYKVCDTVTWPLKETADGAIEVSAGRTDNSSMQEVSRSKTFA